MLPPHGRNTITVPVISANRFDVITSLVSLEHGVYSWEKVTSQRILALERSGVITARYIDSRNAPDPLP
jgi:hypothetical protein